MHELHQHAEHALFCRSRPQGLQRFLNPLNEPHIAWSASSPYRHSSGALHQEQAKKRGDFCSSRGRWRSWKKNTVLAAKENELYRRQHRYAFIGRRLTQIFLHLLQAKSRNDKSAKEVEPTAPAFTRRREAQVGRLAMFGFAASLIGEVSPSGCCTDWDTCLLPVGYYTMNGLLFVSLCTKQLVC